MAQTKAVAKATNKGLALSDALMADVLGAANAEQTIRAASGSNLLWITGPLGGDSEILEPTSDAYIKGAKKNGYVITSKKLNLGTSIDATVIGNFKVFAEMTVPKPGEMAKTVSYWLPEDAMQIPTGDNAFERPLNNGNVLKPVHWVFLYIHDHPELEGVILSFRSTGNKIYTELEKLIKGASKIVPELRFNITSQPIKNETYNKTYYYPKFELQEQRNFALTEDGIKPVSGGLEGEELQTVLERYADLYKSFTVTKSVVSAKANIAGFLPSGNNESSAFDDIEDNDSGEPLKF